MSLSGMRYYGDDRNHSSLRAIIPEDPVGARCFLLGICLEDLFPVRSFEGSKFVRVQRGMPQVGLKKPQAFPDGFEDISSRSEARGSRKKSEARGAGLKIQQPKG